ncbi:tyrosine-type recombinase/integrase [Aeromicrobium duanguangcaii]|uniref:tyrosine-type recombinase/integrase n=1 Tax=Aeromicrobium duanguangcaii TaxID=2968086 RepID=UPI0020181FD0|nr:tyrosine-type recombinase/integrase [Aeromicrobium duanguangcaii]MCL3838008.1 site-specific integrase [Aeromicrobium duanguangcaii]
MANRGADGRPFRLRKTPSGKRWSAERKIASGARSFSATGTTEAEASYSLAVRVRNAGHHREAAEITDWVRAAWPTAAAPEQLGVEGARVDPAASKHLMGDLLDDFLRRRKRNVAPGTYQRDVGKIKNHIRPALGHRYVEDLTTDNLDEFFYDLRQKPKTRPTYDTVTMDFVEPAPGERLLGSSPLRDTYTIVNLVMKDALDKGWIESNPLAGVKRQKRDQEVTLRPEAIQTFDSLIGDLTEDERREFLLAFLGLRQSERLGLGRDSIQKDGRYTILVIDRQLSREGLVVTPVLKTAASRRAFPVPPSIGTYLDDLVEWRRGFGPIGPSDTLLCMPNGKPIRHQTDTNRWHKVLESRGMPRYRMHLLRHWAATMLARQPDITEDLARLFLGHSDVLMTRFYTERSKEQLKAPVEALSALLLPDRAWLNRATDAEREAVGTLAPYRDALLNHFARQGDVEVHRFETVDDFGTVEFGATIGSVRIVYRGVIPHLMDPAMIGRYAEERWEIVERDQVEISELAEEF